jgi:hypothetical protein
MAQEMSVEEMRKALTLRLFELNLLVRCLNLFGVKVTLDLVERVNGAHPDGYTEVVVVGDDDR